MGAKQTLGLEPAALIYIAVVIIAAVLLLGGAMVATFVPEKPLRGVSLEHSQWSCTKVHTGPDGYVCDQYVRNGQ